MSVGFGRISFRCHKSLFFLKFTVSRGTTFTGLIGFCDSFTDSIAFQMWRNWEISHGEIKDCIWSGINKLNIQSEYRKIGSFNQHVLISVVQLLHTKEHCFLTIAATITCHKYSKWQCVGNLKAKIDNIHIHFFVHWKNII